MKKKKHGFLKFLLKVIILIAVVILIKKTGEYFVTREFESFAWDYPFIFQEQDYMEYVTDDFMVMNSYEDQDNQTYATTWESDSSLITIEEDGTAVVTAPATGAVYVTLKETYKKFLWKVSRSYELCVIPGKTISAEDVKVVGIEDVKNGTYNRDMDIVLNHEGEIQYMMGDFKNTFVHSAEDAYEVIKAYRSTFNIPDNVEFRLSSVDNVELLKSFSFDGYVGDFRIDGSCGLVVVNKDTNRVSKVAICSDVDPGLKAEVLSTGAENYDGIITEYLSTNNVVADTEEMLIIENGMLLKANKPVKEYLVYAKSGEMLCVTVDIDSGMVTEYEDISNSVYDKEETIEAIVTNDATETTVCTVKDLDDKEHKFDALKNGSEYWLADVGRDIWTFRDYGKWDIVNKVAAADERKEKVGFLERKARNLQHMKSNFMNELVVCREADFAQEPCRGYANAFLNLQKAYDFYKGLGRTSVDNKGTRLYLVVDQGTAVDNASWTHWLGKYKAIFVGSAKKSAYPFGYYPEVLGHEFTHGVNANYMSSTSSEAGALDEAYADIFGCLIKGDDEWIIGNINRADNLGKENREYMRNLMVINYYVEDDLRQLSNKVYPTKYKDENWDTSDSHVNGVILGHVAYEMYVSNLFTKEEVARIWYNSLGYGYTGEAGFHTCVANVRQAARELGCSPAQMDFILYQFMEVGLWNGVDEFQIENFPEQYDRQELREELESEEWLKFREYAQLIIGGRVPEEALPEKFEKLPVIIRERADSVPGDLMLDNETNREFFVFYSVLSAMLGDGTGIYIYQEDVGATPEEMQELSQKITEGFNEMYPGLNVMGNDVIIEVEQKSKLQLKVLNAVCEKLGNKMHSFTMQEMGMDTKAEADMVTELLGYAFNWYSTKSTAYEFYDDFGLIE